MNIIIIPAYEPDMTLTKQVRELVEKGYCIIVTDDGSGEKYAPVFETIKENVVLLRHDENQGKGNAIKTALAYILENIPDAGSIAVMDADGQHSTKDVERVLFASRLHQDSLILGVRQFSDDIPRASRLGNLITRKIFQISSGRKVSDTQTGLRAITKKMLVTFLSVPGERYEYEMNVLYACARKKIPIVEIPIETIYHDENNSCSHFRKWRDSIRIYHQIVKFALSSGSSFLLDYVLFAVFLILFGRNPFGILAGNVMARMVSAFYNYHMNARFVFHTDAVDGRKSMISYAMLATGILCCNNVILYLLLHFAGISAMPAKVITEIILFLISFTVQNLFIFRKQLQPEMHR